MPTSHSTPIVRRLAGSLHAEYRKPIRAGKTRPAIDNPMLRMTTGGCQRSCQAHSATPACAAITPHSSQLASSGTRARKRVRATARSQLGSGSSQDSYQIFRAPGCRLTNAWA